MKRMEKSEFVGLMLLTFALTLAVGKATAQDANDVLAVMKAFAILQKCAEEPDSSVCETLLSDLPSGQMHESEESMLSDSANTCLADPTRSWRQCYNLNRKRDPDSQWLPKLYDSLDLDRPDIKGPWIKTPADQFITRSMR